MAAQSYATTLPPSSIVKSRRHELRHRAQSMMEEAEPFETHSEEEYETEIPEEQEDAFLEEEMAHFAEEIIEYTNMARGIVAETVLGFIWVSLLQQVKPVQWSNSPSKLILIGNIFALLSPVLSARRFFLPYLSHPFGQAVLRLVCLGGILSYQITSNVISSLMLMASHSAAMLSLCSAWWSLSARKRTLSFWGLVLGMFFSLTLKVFYNSSTNPIYCDTATNSLGALVGLIATADRFLTTYGKSHSHRSPLDKIIVDWSWLVVGSGFGSLMFLSRWLFGDISEQFQWAVQDQSTVGKTVLWRTTVVVIMATGVFFSKHVFMLKWYWVLMSMLAVCAVCLSSQFLALIGALVLCLLIMSAWPAVVDRVTCRSPARTLILTMSVYMLLVYFVGCNDVTPLQLSSVLVTSCLFIGLALQCSCSEASNSSYSSTVGKIKKKDSFSEPRKMDAVIEEDEDSELETEVRSVGSSIVISRTAFPLLDGDQYLFFRTHVRPVLVTIVITTIIGVMFRSEPSSNAPP